MKNKQSYSKVVFYSALIVSMFLLIGCEKSSPESEQISKIEIEGFRVILPPPVSSGTAAYGTIKNTGTAGDTLIDISSNAGSTMLHKTEIESGVAEMIHIEEYRLEPKSQLVLKPLSYHLMLMNINHEIVKENGSVELLFTFKNAGVIKIMVPVVRE